jgi:NADH-quinone oxidoreductase subunit D
VKSEGRSAESAAAKKSEKRTTKRDQAEEPASGQSVDAAMPVEPRREITYADFVEGTDEGDQQLLSRGDVPAKERLREVGAVLRMSEAEAALLGELPDDPDEDQTMIINMGPQHPSTHGVLRLMLELQGETVLRCKPIIGYLHTGMEKTGEQLTYMQGGTNVTRMDYLSPFANELVFSMATEKLLGIDGEIPERATWIRMLMAELNRMSSHLLFMATNGMDLGAVSMMIYGWREREEVLRFFQEVTGLRMNHNYIRPGGVAADLPAGWRDGVMRLLDLIAPRLDEYEILLSGQPIYRERLQGVGVITPDEALALGATGPILRATGVEWDLRRHMPYLHYDELDFDVVVGTYGDSFDRYAIRLAEIRESMRIVEQIVERMPSGDYRIQDKKVTPPPRARIDESMEALIHHFKLFTEGFKVPEGEVYVGIESPRGEVGCYLASDGGPNPYRMHVRAPSFVNIQCLPHMMRGGLVADAVAIISSVDPVLGDVDR